MRSSHCSDVSSLLELGLALDEDGRSRFCGVIGRPFDGVILILGASPLACFIPSCEKGFCGGFEVLGELEILIFVLGCSCSAAAGAFELDGECEAAATLLLSSPLVVD